MSFAQERGEMLISIAHPDFRQELTERLRGLKAIPLIIINQ